VWARAADGGDSTVKLRLDLYGDPGQGVRPTCRPLPAERASGEPAVVFERGLARRDPGTDQRPSDLTVWLAALV
jgi:hypothetical protein